jgi:mono/diheme cytochrome c family protein
MARAPGCARVFTIAIMHTPVPVTLKAAGWALVQPALALMLVASTALAAEVSFNRDIRPILSDNCYACHGPDRNTRKAKLRLDVPEGAFAEYDGGHAIVPGKPEQSVVMQRLLTSDPDDLMPPPKSAKKLSPQQIELIRQWIAQGAKYEGHWAFTPPARPALPTVQSSRFKVQGSSVHPVDAFILARLEKENVAPSPEADKRTLIRRLALDLTGLPPDPKDVAAFVNSRDPRAYERQVDKYLASDAYAERMTMQWLDWVRYADTIGFHGDCDFSVWPYRDYVLRAFRDDLPYDRFTREQLAGDLLPGATEDQRVASAFNRLLRISTEGGAQDKEYLAKYAADRVRTTTGVWLGATMGCAECHDHKFDPYTMKDFYSFAAFFADLSEKGFYAKGFAENDWGPKLLLPTPEQKTELDELKSQIEALRHGINSVGDDLLGEGRARWEERVLALERAKQLDWRVQTPLRAASAGGATLSIGEDKTVTAGGDNPDTDTYTVSFQPGAGVWHALRLETLTDEMFAGNRIARAGTTFVITDFRVSAGDGRRARPVRLDHVMVDSDGDGFPAVAMLDGHADTGWAITSGHSRAHQAAFHFASPLVTDGHTTVTVRIAQESKQRRATIGKFKLAMHELERPSYENKTMPDSVLKALQIAPDKRNDDQKKLITDFYRRISPELARLNRELAQLEAQHGWLLAQVPSTLVSEAAATPRTMRVLPRGNWMDDSGAEVLPAVPAFMGKLETAGQRPNRLDLADWITSRDNPLTARVMVNRLWKQFFGAGFTRTPEDLGAQGEWPTHPELLDWLAREFMEPSAGQAPAWSIKHIVRLIVTSQTYKQSSVGRADLDERDPDNRLLARQGRFRLDAELVRDNALAVSGLLVSKFGGPSVKPYQPEGYYLPLNFPKREYQHDHGSDLYRRGLYTHWQRTFLHPSLMAFDAPSREECTVNRPNSNTPLQALVLLNDPIYVEAARVFAENIMRLGGRSVEGRIDWAFERALARSPRKAEVTLLSELYGKELARFNSEGRAAEELLGVGEYREPRGLRTAELAAWTSVTRAILNLHETITRY